MSNQVAALFHADLHRQDEIFGSAYASAVYLSSVIKLPKTKKVYVIGMGGLEEELRDEGISYLGGTVPTNSLDFAKFSDAIVLPLGSCGQHAPNIFAGQLYT